MNDIDRTIERALSTLRDPCPRTGLNDRILAALEHRSVAPQSTRFALSARLALWPSLAACAIAIASFVILHHREVHQSPNPVTLSEAPSGAQPNAGSPTSARCLLGCKDPGDVRVTSNPRPFSTTNPTRTPQTLSSRPEPRSLAARRSGETCISDRIGCRVPQVSILRSGIESSDVDAQALADLHAPSHPAPPLPLTPQEKLFLRMLRYGNATELAELDPAMRAKDDADETTAFKSFFPDPPQQPGDKE